MGRRVLVIVLLLILAALAYVGYSSYDAKRAEASGDVFSLDSPVGRTKTDTGVAADSKDASSARQTVVYPGAAQPTQSAPDNTAQTSVNAGASVAPGGDTISPNPPNGM